MLTIQGGFYISFIERFRTFRAKKKRTVKVAWVGLDHAGKTTVINWVTHGTFTDKTKRTLGMNVNEFVSEGIKFMSWDIGGQISFRDSLWNAYISGSAGIIFVVDAADADRFGEAKQELWKYVLNNKKVGDIPILILANKQDLPQARSAGEVARALDLHKVINHSYAILPTSAVNGYNLEDALEWLRQRITEVI